MSHTETRPDVLALLQLPERAKLTDGQQRGAICVWCPEALTGESAVDFGEQQDSEGQSWFPRACRRDVAARAHDALFTHRGTCEQCTDNATVCDLVRVLYRLVRQEWR
jgi:hypothetical protein